MTLPAIVERVDRRNEEVLDLLADVMFATDEILGMLRRPEMRPPRWLAPIEPRLVEIYEGVNDLMKRMSQLGVERDEERQPESATATPRGRS